MNLKNTLSVVSDKLTKTAGKLSFDIKAKSPEILLVTGILTGAAAIVTACIATRKIDGVLDEHNEELEQLSTVKEDENTEMTKSKIYIRTGLKLTKLYGPTAVLAAVSGTCAFGAYKITDKRLNSMSAAFMATDRAFKKYRETVINRFGEEIDQQIRFGEAPKKIAEGDNAAQDKTLPETALAPAGSYDPTVRIFDETICTFEKNPSFNLNYLLGVQNWATNRLRQRGFLTLNEVLETIGYTATPESTIIGWVYDRSKYKYKGDANEIALPLLGDDYVDFGIYKQNNARFVNGDIPEVWLTFNTHGNVYSLMK